MELDKNSQYVGFGVGLVNRFTRNRMLHAKDTVMGVLSSVKHMRLSSSLTYRHNAHKIAEAAYQSGFRIFDTARIYGYSEAELGKMMASHNREELFICTKVSDMDLTREGGAETVRGNLMNSLKDLGTNYVDLYLLHWPTSDWVDMYQQMDELYREGLTKHIGVCNFEVSNFETLAQIPGITFPQFCQLECHPFCMHRDVLKYCREHGITVLAHTPTGRMKPEVRTNPVLNEIAKAHGKSVPQVILRWHVQSGRIPITHTKDSGHIRDNMDIFDFALLDEEIERIDALNQENRLFRTIGIDNPNYKYNK